MKIENNKKEESKDVITINNTDSYRIIGTIILIISIIVGLFLIYDYNLTAIGIGVISGGISLKIILLIAYSICYRLDLIIEKK